MIVIPFRDRGRDPLRKQNLDRVLAWWDGVPWPVMLVDDDRDGDEQFNRHRAYNKGRDVAEMAGASVVVYAEADILIPHGQVTRAVELARSGLGLVVPFNVYGAMSPEESERVRRAPRPGKVTADRAEEWRSVGPVNVVSLATLDAVGQWDENFEGNWYDDTAMERAFGVCAGPRRHVEGPAYHLYHLPGWTGDHRTPEDLAATERNRLRWERYAAAQTPEEIRELTLEGR